MDVLFDARLLHRSLSGLERCQRNLVEQLAKRPEITRLRILVQRGTELPMTIADHVEAIEVENSVDILRVLLNEDRAERPQVYHLSWFPDRYPMDLLLPLAAHASVVEVHDAILNRHPEYHPNPETWRWYDEFIKTLVHNADRILLHSESVRRELEEDLDGNPAIADMARLAVDPALREPIDDAEVAERLARIEVSGDYFVAVGKDYPHKDHATLLRALAKSENDAQLICAGSRVWDYETDSTDDVTRELGLAERVRWIPGLDDQDLKALILGAKALVFPSLEEGFGLPPLEAMVLGTPVIAAAAMSIPEVCRDGAWLFTPGDVDELAVLLDRVLDGGEEVDALIARGKVREAEMSWERTAIETVKCYENALASAESGDRPRPTLCDQTVASLWMTASSPHGDDQAAELKAWKDRCMSQEDDLTHLHAWKDRCLAREAEVSQLRSHIAGGGPMPPVDFAAESYDGLVAQIDVLTRGLRDRERWIATLLEEVSRRRLKLRPRRLAGHEQDFLSHIRR